MHQKAVQHKNVTTNMRTKKGAYNCCFIMDTATYSTEQDGDICVLNAQGSCKPKKMVHFNCDSQPIGEGSISFVSYLGSVTRKRCPVSYEHWKDVPDKIKERIWKLVTDKYIISASYKKYILQRVNKHWREFKSKLRSKHYDIYETNEDRKLNCPRGVRYVDWSKFVDNQSTPNAQTRRRKGKSAREALKTPHTYGRRGAARTIKGMSEGGTTRSIQERSASPEVSGSCSTLDPEHTICEDIYFSKQKKMVCFDDNGQPVGEGSVSFTSNLGSLTRRYCPISYEQWRDVPDQIKELMWKLLTDEYIVSVTLKEQILKRISKHWREFKSQLRSKHYDMYSEDSERKKNCPQGVRQKDWNLFVDNQSTPEAQARRRRGKSARGAMKTPHTSGRQGAARTADKLRKRDLSAIITETDSCFTTISSREGSRSTQELSKTVNNIKPAVGKPLLLSTYADVDYDIVEDVNDPDVKGRVQGLDTVVRRSALLSSASARDQLQYVKRMRISVEEQALI